EATQTGIRKLGSFNFRLIQTIYIQNPGQTPWGDENATNNTNPKGVTIWDLASDLVYSRAISGNAMILKLGKHSSTFIFLNHSPLKTLSWVVRKRSLQTKEYYLKVYGLHAPAGSMTSTISPYRSTMHRAYRGAGALPARRNRYAKFHRPLVSRLSSLAASVRPVDVTEDRKEGRAARLHLPAGGSGYPCEPLDFDRAFRLIGSDLRGFLGRAVRCRTFGSRYSEPGGVVTHGTSANFRSGNFKFILVTRKRPRRSGSATSSASLSPPACETSEEHGTVSLPLAGLRLLGGVGIFSVRRLPAQTDHVTRAARDRKRSGILSVYGQKVIN
ncbi:unnamed protein product, partial [Nesidiocoris tenuis]